jgi:ATP synthase protein I
MAESDNARKKLAARIGRKAERRQKARARKNRGLWYGLGMFGLVGWSVAVPTVLGIAAGVWLDKLWPGPPSWTLTLLFLGVVLGCLNAWHWIQREANPKKDD